MSEVNKNTNSIGALNHEVSLDNIINNAKKELDKESSSNEIFPSFKKTYDLIDAAITR